MMGMGSFNFESALTIVGLVVYVATFMTLPILFARNITNDRPRALRSATKETAELISQWTVWLVLLSGLSYAALVGVDEHGVAVVVSTVVAPLVLASIGLLVGWIYSRSRPKKAE